jgi:ABC-type transport system involved in cytochrome c biogenesis permease subunit
MNLTFLYFSLIAYFISALFGLFRSKQAKYITAFSVIGLIIQIIAIVIRGNKIGFLPFASQFDSMILFGLAIQLSAFILFALCGYNSVKFINDFFTIIIILAALVFVREPDMNLLNPMLNSQYFAYHILFAFLGYGVYISGLALSIASIFDKQVRENKIIPLKLAYAGLILLGAAILIGAIWADNSWGIYWSWDPKESWALVTWMLIMLYVHIYPKVKQAWLTGLFYGLAIAVMLFTFIGIRLLHLGLHSY